MPKLVDKQQLKKDIALKAFEAFIEEGIGGFSLSEFLQRIGMPKGRFYYYFESKEVLLFEAMKSYMNVMFDQFDERVDWQASLSEKLKVAYDFFLAEQGSEILLKKRQFVADVIHFYIQSENPVIRTYVMEHMEASEKILGRILDDEIAKGHILPSSRSMVITIEATVLGLVQTALLLDNFDFNTELMNYFETTERLLRTEAQQQLS